jgi:thioredoxin-like negative regulator of GroEL
MITTRCRIARVAAENRTPRRWPAGGVPRLTAFFSVILLVVFTRSAPADDIAWRYDYNAARKEALEKNRPLVLDFSTENCYYCAQLDRITFHDPVIVGLVNDKFIPLKVDAQKNALLTEALHIERFPTLVLAAPDGKILATIEGYRDPEPFHGHLQRALASVNNPEWMVRDYQEASRAAAASDYSRAVALLKSIVEDGKDRPIQGKARELLHDLEQQAASRLAHARQLEDKGQNSEALDVLTELLRAFPGTPAANEAGQMLSVLTLKPEVQAQQRTRRARELLAQAKEDYRTQQYLGCMDRCEILASSYADLPEGAEAVQLAAEIKNNPEWMSQACENLSDRLGLMYLSLAETWVKKGQTQQATQCLERVIQAFPGSRQAETAQTRLAQIQGHPTQQADFKKP